MADQLITPMCKVKLGSCPVFFQNPSQSTIRVSPLRLGPQVSRSGVFNRATPKQTRQILLGQAEDAKGSQNSLDPHGGPGKVDFAPWHEFQEWLSQSVHRVVIPYATAVAELITPGALRIRRDFPKIRNLIRAHALLHQQNRDRDPDGNIITKPVDYSRVLQANTRPTSAGS